MGRTLSRRAPLGCLVLALALALALGCVRIGATSGQEIAPDDVRRIVPGHTTRTEILAWFGAPAEASDGAIFARLIDAGDMSSEDLAALPFSDLLVYEILEGQARLLFLGLFNWADVQVKRDRLMIFFDDDDRVLYYGITRQREREEAAPEEVAVEEPQRRGIGPGKRGQR